MEKVTQYIVTLSKDNQPDEYFGPFTSEMAARVFMERAAKEQEKVNRGQAFIKKNFAIVNTPQSESVWSIDALNNPNIFQKGRLE